MKIKNTYIILGIAAALLLVVAGWILFSPKTITEDVVAVNNIYDYTPQNHFHGIGFDNTNNQLYIATHYGLYVLKDDSDLYFKGSSRDDFMGFSLNQKNPKIIYTSGHPRTGGNFGARKSTDGGLTWETIFRNIGSGAVDFHSMTIGLTDANVLAGYYQGRIYVTEDGGENWRFASGSVPQGACWGAPCLTVDSQERNRIYAGTQTGLYVTDNLGESWRLVSQGSLAGVAVHPNNNNIIYAYGQEGIIISNDKGQNWKTKGNLNLLGNEYIFQFSFDIDNPEVIYAATTGQRIFKTQNAGDSWSPILK